MIGLRALIALSLSMAILAGQPALAQKEPPAADPKDRVVITGTVEKDAIRNFVGAVTQRRTPQDQLSRWDRKICPGLIGLNARHSQGVLNRIAQRAEAVGLAAGKSGCAPNILIIFTRDPSGAAQALADQFPQFVRKADRFGQSTLGGKALEAFKTTTAPVRWWFISDTVTEDGRRVAAAEDGSRPTMQVYGASLLHRQMRQDFASAVVIVDAIQADGISFPALADYLAMASLAQIDPTADASGFDTILNLFAKRAAGDPPIAEMTAWDLAYLESLYKAPRTASSAKVQQRAITDRMSKDLATK